jgi:hypothetical protein
MPRKMRAENKHYGTLWVCVGARLLFTAIHGYHPHVGRLLVVPHLSPDSDHHVLDFLLPSRGSRCESQN